MWIPPVADGISVAPDGTVVRVTWAVRDGEIGRVQFDQDDPISLFVDGHGWGGQYPVIAKVGADHQVILQGHTPDSVNQQGSLLVSRNSGSVTRLLPHGGAWPMWITPDGTIHRAPPAAGSQGYAWVDDDGVEVYNDDVPAKYWAPAAPLKRGF